MRTASVSTGVSSQVFSNDGVVKIGPKISRGLYRRLKAAARILGRSVQDLLNEAIEEWLQNHQQEIIEAARRLGIEILGVNSPVNEEKKVVG